MMKKVIFLDIDGVLNSENFFKKQERNNDKEKTLETYLYSMLDDEAFERLRTIIEKTGGLPCY